MSQQLPGVSEPDASAAGERTFLAWHRSALTTFLVAAVMARAGSIVAAVLAVGLGLAFELVGVRRLTALHNGVSLPPPLAPNSIRFVALGVVAVAAIAAATV